MNRMLWYVVAASLLLGALPVAADGFGARERPTSGRERGPAQHPAHRFRELPPPGEGAPGDGPHFDADRIRKGLFPGVHRSEDGVRPGDLASPPSRTEAFEHLYRDGDRGARHARPSPAPVERPSPNLFRFRF